jgi:hypothetical protein
MGKGILHGCLFSLQDQYTMFLRHRRVVHCGEHHIIIVSIIAFDFFIFSAGMVA